MAVDENYQRKLEDQKRLFKQLGIKFDALTIHEKDFTTKMRGYSQEEVDFFLDDVILDYERFYKIITDLLDKYNELQRRQTYEKERVMAEKERIHEEKERAFARAQALENGVDKSVVTEAILSLERTIAQMRARLQEDRSDKY
ncbi:DivIVA domain-containing protein [Paenibacillus wulumuqiensis]|uniref:DivIVA domain-containing protein n=1 Tax=Paenibacillus wulumuqiensis TaxID=1567107 RepID=UPI000619995F|nr:DivIVA domain-containing protein [Paenibacillus wulumuqiensis]